MIDTAIDKTGETYLFFTPRDNGKLSIRTKPYRLYLAPEVVDSFDNIPLLYAVVPGQIDRDYFYNCCQNIEEGEEWSLYYGDEVTIISYDEPFYTKQRDGFHFYPFQDLEVVLGMLVERSVTHEDIDWEKIPQLYPYDSIPIKNAAVEQKLDWLYPVWDATQQDEPYWVASVQALAGHLSANAGDVTRDTMFDLIDEQGIFASSSYPSPDSPIKARKVFNIDHYIGNSDVEKIGDDTKHWPLGIEPSFDPEEVVGDRFGFKEKRWEVTRVYEPISPKIGWMVQVRSDDDFISGLTQFAYEVFIGDADLSDMIPWASSTVTYRERFAEVGIDEDAPLDWTRYHRRVYLQNIDDDVHKIKEYRDGDFYIAKYEYDGNRYKRTRRKQWDEWVKQSSLEKLKQESHKEKMNKLRDQLIPDKKKKDKKKNPSGVSKEQMDILSNLT